MSNVVVSFTRISSSWRRALLGALALLAAITAATPAAADPAISYSTFLGGSLGEAGRAVATWGSTTFVAGSTRSLDYLVFVVTSRKPYDQLYGPSTGSPPGSESTT